MTAVYRTVQEVSDLLNVRPRTLRRMIRNGDLAAVKIGKAWRIPDGVVEQLLATDGRLRGPRRLFMTTDEFLRLPEETLPVQLIKGYVVRDPAPFVPHQVLVGRLYILLHRAIAEQGQGTVLLSPTDVVLSGDTVLQPDALAVSEMRSHIITNRVEGPPDLVVEVEAENTRERDMTSKRMLYAKYGVPEFWFVSGRREFLVQMTEPVDDDYRVKAVHEKPATVTARAFPGLTVSLDQLLEGYGRR